MKAGDLCISRRVATVAAASVIGLAACSEPAPPPAAPKPVRVQSVAVQPAAGEFALTGAVRARVESELAFRVGGKLVRRSVDVGQQVRAGEQIAELDAQDFQLALAAAGNQQRAARVEAEQAAADARRFEALRADGAVSDGDAERQRARADAAAERLAQAQRALDLARNRDQYAVLRAPYDGVVTSLRADVGQVVGEGQPVVALARNGEREIEVDVPESRVMAARRAAATAALWTEPERRFAVTLRELSPLASPVTRTYRARYRVGPDAPPMALGMTAVIMLNDRREGPDEVLAALPASALHQRDGQPAVWVVDADGGTLALAPVRLAHVGQEEIRVAGLRPGQLVVTAGAQKLGPGMKVTAVDAQGQAISPPTPHAGALADAARPARVR